MRKFYLLILLCIGYFPVSAQEEGNFPFGIEEGFHLAQTTYSKDSTADAYVIKEFGSAYISERENTGLVFTYHVKIKILSNKGLDQANIVIPLRRSESSMEIVRDIQATTTNLENGLPQHTSLEHNKIYTEKVSDYYERKKFTFPNVKVGSIIEYQYTLESPFIFNFHNWEFQSDIPKIESDYWAKIPGNYNYNIALFGFKKLDRQNAELIKDCFKIGGGVADCSLMKFGMKDIPAFVEEDYMTASKNFSSAIRFELMEIKYFDGRVQHITKTWQDIYRELKTDADFGVQIKRHSELFKDQILKLQASNKNQKDLARGVYDLVKDWYRWDEYYGKYAEKGLKKAYETRTGNVGDINLALIGALQYAGINTDPVLVSTRENGVPTKLFPVMSEFNYVIAKVNLNKESFLLDATDKDLPFGVLPFRCLNKEGRAIGKDSCYWVNLTPNKTTENPFKLNERIYPIDFGAQKDFSTIFQLEIPENYEVKLLPTSVALRLPENSGKYVFKSDVLNSSLITVSEFFTIDKAEIPGSEYPYLKELYNKIVQSNKSNIIISKK